jgi:hypothetical protein
MAAAELRTKTPAARALLVIGAICLHCAAAPAAEVCRYMGTTDYAGHVAVTTRVAVKGSATQVDVAATFDSSSMFWFGVHYRVEELSSWRAGQLESVAVNSRYLVGERIIRQQWDDFQRGAGSLEAYRVQAKTLDDFRHRHPGFAGHWDPATFGQAWLGDYPAASPERRADLDLKAAPAGLRSPLALAFYWVRSLRHGSEDVPVFLPGFKADRLVDVPVASAGSGSGTLWHTSLHYPALLDSPPSTATALIAPDGHLSELAFELHMHQGSGQGTITLAGCEGAAVTQ